MLYPDFQSGKLTFYMLGYMENKTAKRKLERIENPDMDGQSPTGTVGMEKGGSGQSGWRRRGQDMDGQYPQHIK